MKNSKEIKIKINIKLDDLLIILMVTGLLLIISAFIQIWIVGVVFIVMGAFGYILSKYNEAM